jgi:hypothetical protein
MSASFSNTFFLRAIGGYGASTKTRHAQQRQPMSLPSLFRAQPARLFDNESDVASRATLSRPR